MSERSNDFVVVVWYDLPLNLNFVEDGARSVGKNDSNNFVNTTACVDRRQRCIIDVLLSSINVRPFNKSQTTYKNVKVLMLRFPESIGSKLTLMFPFDESDLKLMVIIKS